MGNIYHIEDSVADKVKWLVFYDANHLKKRVPVFMAQKKSIFYGRRDFFYFRTLLLLGRTFCKFTQYGMPQREREREGKRSMIIYRPGLPLYFLVSKPDCVAT